MNNEQFKSLILFILLTITAILPIACNTLNVSSMIPDQDGSSNIQIPKTVCVMNVTGGIDVKPGVQAQYVSNEMFKEALSTSLKNAKIFKAIVDNNSDMELYASIKEQRWEQYRNAYSPRLIIVEYRLMDKHFNQIVWCETYHSECMDPNPHRGLECAIRTNLTSLTARLQSNYSNFIAQ